MSDEANVVLFRIPLCGRCKKVEANLAQVRKLRPDLRVLVYTLPDHIGLARKHGLLNIPSMIICGKPFGGVLSTEQILAALGPAA